VARFQKTALITHILWRRWSHFRHIKLDFRLIGDRPESGHLRRNTTAKAKKFGPENGWRAMIA